MLHYALRRPVPHSQREQQVCRPAFRLRQPRLFCDDPRKKYLIHIHPPFYRSCIHFLCCLLRRFGACFLLSFAVPCRHMAHSFRSPLISGPTLTVTLASRVFSCRFQA